MANYFNSLPLRLQLEQLGVCGIHESIRIEVAALKKEKKLLL
jgi:hypothetical protein